MRAAPASGASRGGAAGAAGRAVQRTGGPREAGAHDLTASAADDPDGHQGEPQQ